MTIGDWFVLWIGLQEAIAGILYLTTGDYWKALVWAAYGLACLGLAMTGTK